MRQKLFLDVIIFFRIFITNLEILANEEQLNSNDDETIIFDPVTVTATCEERLSKLIPKAIAIVGRKRL